MPESSRWSTISTSILTVCAILVTAAVVKREFFPSRPGAQVDREVPGATAVAGTGHIMGPPTAAVSLLVFSDFQCPFCSVLQQSLKRLQARYPGAVRVEYRHLPIESIHPFAFDAAMAAECAGAQGRFESFHDVLFENQDSIPAERWGAFAREAGVPDLASFDQCLSTRTFESRVRADLSAARELDLRGTPSVIVGTTLLGGTPSLSTLDSIVRRVHPALVGASTASAIAGVQP